MWSAGISRVDDMIDACLFHILHFWQEACCVFLQVQAMPEKHLSLKRRTPKASISAVDELVSSWIHCRLTVSVFLNEMDCILSH